jgi:hypothetical protein
MSSDQLSERDAHVVDVTGARLFEIVKRIIQAGPDAEAAIVKNFGAVMFTVALKDAEAIKSFIGGMTAQAPPGLEATSASSLDAAMPADFDHCKRRSQ